MAAVRALHSLTIAGIEAQEKSDKPCRLINDHLGREIDQRHDFVNFATKPNWNLKTRKRLHRRGHHDNLNYGNRMRIEIRI